MLQAAAAETSAPTVTCSESNEKNLFSSCFQLIGKTTFHKSTTSSSSSDCMLNICVYSINIYKCLEPANAALRDAIKKKFKLKRFNDLSHSICALYDNCLPDLGASSVYECITAQKSYTIFITKEDPTLNEESIIPDHNEDDNIYQPDDCLTQLENEHPLPDSLFKDIFSDESESDHSESESTDQLDFTRGLKTFLKNNHPTTTDPLVKNLIACATLQRCILFPLAGQEEWVIDLELMAVRKKYRGFNIGKYLISFVQNKQYVKNYDAIVTSSDVDACGFYDKYGFVKDPILNSKYGSIGDIWTNTTKMCFIPPYVGIGSVSEGETSFISELAHIEKDFKRWQKASFGAYQCQAGLFMKLKQEVFTLKAKLFAKDGIIEDLQVKNDLLTRKNRALSLKIENLEIESN